MFDTETRTVVVVGAQWGDEGKGKLVDVLAERADWVVRYQGGANAGHTVDLGTSCFILQQIPSGILHPGVRCAIGNGVVLDPETLFTEIERLVKGGVDVEGRLYDQRSGAPGAAIPQAGRRRELGEPGDRHDRSRDRPGVRGQGRAARCSGARPAASGATWRGLVERGVDHANARLAHFGSPKRANVDGHLPTLEASCPAAAGAGRRCGTGGASGDRDGRGGPARRCAGLVARRRSRHLSLRHLQQHDVGWAQRSVWASRPTAIDAVLGVVKAYTTRVGNGPLPTEFDEPLASAHAGAGARVRRGHRAPAALRVVRRGRRAVCGARQWPQWAGGHEARRAGYARSRRRSARGTRSPGACHTEFPGDLTALEHIGAALRVVRWVASSRPRACGGWRIFHRAARRYLDRIESLVEAPIRFVSVGTRRDQIIEVAGAVATS